jgi:tetratricopeptide (TPR) repeat protein
MEMATRTIDIKCPNCGAVVDTGQKTCKFCKQPVVISTFNSVYDMPMPLIDKYANAYRQALSESPENQELNNSIAMCYLKLKLYGKALRAFEKAMEDNFDNSETFFYAAICLLNGGKAFLTQRATIDKIEEYINAALMIEPKGIYYYFWAYIKQDYFSRKFYNTSPTYQEALASATNAGVSSFDTEQLWGILGVQPPTVAGWQSRLTQSQEVTSNGRLS